MRLWRVVNACARVSRLYTPTIATIDRLFNDAALLAPEAVNAREE